MNSPLLDKFKNNSASKREKPKKIRRGLTKSKRKSFTNKTSNNTSIKLFYSNINGYRSKKLSLQSIVADINADLICLVETKTKYRTSVKFPEFHDYTRVRSTNSGGLYIGVRSCSFHNNLKITDIDHTDIISVRTEINNNIFLRLILAYGPQDNESIDIKEKFYIDFEIEIGRAKLSGDHVLALGDFNAKRGSEFIPNDTPERSANGDILSQIIERKELIAVNGTEKCLGTWTRQNNLNEQEKSVIDYVLVNEDLYNHIDHMEIDEQKSFCPFGTTKLKNRVKTTYSDHMSIVIDFKLKKDWFIKKKVKIMLIGNSREVDSKNSKNLAVEIQNFVM